MDKTIGGRDPENVGSVNVTWSDKGDKRASLWVTVDVFTAGYKRVWEIHNAVLVHGR